MSDDGPQRKKARHNAASDAKGSGVKLAPKKPLPGVHHAPTVKDIIADPITKLSLEHWAPNSPQQHKAFDPKIIEDIYYQQLVAQDDFNTSKIMLLELSLYLEKYPYLLRIFGNFLTIFSMPDLLFFILTHL